LVEILAFSDSSLAAALEHGFSKVGQSCRFLSWEKLDKAALVAFSQGVGAIALVNFCRVVCRGARRAGFPDLMLWRNVDGESVHLFLGTRQLHMPVGKHSALCVEVKGPRDSVRDEQRFVPQLIVNTFFQTHEKWNRYWMHELSSCGIAVELLRVKEPQQVSQLSEPAARKKKRMQLRDVSQIASTVAAESSSSHSNVTCSIIHISSDDDVFEIR
jgi:hypothetical protein